MENASKSLLIAAAVLIAIVLISVGLVLLNSGNGTTQKAGEVGEELESTGQVILGDIHNGMNSINKKQIMLITGSEFNRQVKGGVPNADTTDTNITKIVFDYWSNGYKDGGTVIRDWNSGEIIDLNKTGEIRLFKSADKKTAYILSGGNIYANTNCTSMFSHFESLEKIVFNNFNTSQVTNMGAMFNMCTNITEYDLSCFDTSNVTQMNNMFNSNHQLTAIDLRNFNTSEVTAMNGMFAWCTKLENVNVSGWETNSVTTMYRMFKGSFQSKRLAKTVLDLTNFQTKTDTNVSEMFQECTYLGNVKVSKDKWEASTALGVTVEKQ